MQIIEDKTFTKATIEEIRTQGGQFEYCSFVQCDLRTAHLSNLIFIDCSFKDCYMANCSLQNTGLQNVKFTDCNLTSMDFSKTRDFLFETHFDNCILDNAIFYSRKNKGAKYINCSCKEVDFTQVDCTNAIFDNCNLHRAIFDNTNLKGADFTTSYNYIIDPDRNMVKKTKFSVHGLPGLLTRYDIVIK